MTGDEFLHTHSFQAILSYTRFENYLIGLPNQIKSFISDNTVHIKSKKKGYRGTDRSTNKRIHNKKGDKTAKNSLTHDCTSNRLCTL